MNKLSIIIPIYKVEGYLCKCVDSVLNQDLPSSEYEIILVDDGSPDKCPQICDEYAAAHENIRVIHRENGGLSAARNSGIEIAQGEYLMFVDSDDYIEPNVLGKLMAQVERENLDVLRFDYQNVRIKEDRNYEVFQPYKNLHEVDKRQNVVDGITYLNERMPYTCYAWQFLLRCDLIIGNQTSHITHHTLENKSSLFTEGIHFEDTDWLPRVMLQAKCVNSTTSIVYNYFWREGSITLTQGNKDKVKKNVEDFLFVIDKYNDYIYQYTACKWLKNMQSCMVSGVLTTIACELYEERKIYINRLKALNVFPLSIDDQGKTYKRRAMITNLFGAEIYCRLMNFAR